MIRIKIKKSITEGGNVFAGKTAPIPKAFIDPTLDKYYEELDRLFPQHSGKFRKFEPLGSVGKKEESGDIDLAVSAKVLFPNKTVLFKSGEINSEELESWNISS